MEAELTVILNWKWSDKSFNMWLQSCSSYRRRPVTGETLCLVCDRSGPGLAGLCPPLIANQGWRTAAWKGVGVYISRAFCNKGHTLGNSRYLMWGLGDLRTKERWRAPEQPSPVMFTSANTFWRLTVIALSFSWRLQFETADDEDFFWVLENIDGIILRLQKLTGQLYEEVSLSILIMLLACPTRRWWKAGVGQGSAFTLVIEYAEGLLHWESSFHRDRVRHLQLPPAFTGDSPGEASQALAF